MQDNVLKFDKEKVSIDSDELLGFLNYDTPELIKANAILTIGRCKFNNEYLIDRLYKIACDVNSNKPVLSGLCNSHIACASLYLLGTDKSIKRYNDALSQFNDRDRTNIKQFIQKFL